ncbi:MAG: TIM barrel protein [Gammaproteobacteria bacterium]|nr:TIM barrel protein [Gammaproteobacteria bacterium]
MKLTACIEWLFEDETDNIAERIYKAKEAGLEGVEFHLWRDKPIAEIKQALEDTGITLTSFCVDPRRSIVDESQLAEFVSAVSESADIAQQLNCQQMIIASGFLLADTSPEQHFNFALRALKKAAEIGEQTGVTLLLEPINTKVDHPGMYLDSNKVGLDLVEAVNSPRLRLLYDAYHSLVMGEDIETIIAGRTQWVAHIQIADMPGRGAPGTGAVNWSAVTHMLKNEGYQGWIGLEYKLNDLSTREALTFTRNSLKLTQ